MKAVTQRRAADAQNTLVNRVQRSAAEPSVQGNAQVRLQIVLNSRKNLDGFVVVTAGDAVGTCLEHMGHAQPGPRPHAYKDSVDIAHTIEAHNGRVDPTVEGNVR